MSLDSAIHKYVRPGFHLHFASTPSRSNVAIRALARQYAGARPAFTLSTTGMHSTAHLLGLLRLGHRYIACFYGDNYPSPRPNALYQALEYADADLEHWSLSSYVAAFRAGARGEPYAVTTSLRGTELASQLARRGRYFEVPDPVGRERPVSLVAALRADVTFLHAAVGDEDGHALFSAPFCEGFYAAHGAKLGVIVTVEKIVPRGSLRGHPDQLPVFPARVLAVCHAPKGAQPQPLHAVPEEFRALGYGDDPQQYRLWRQMTEDPALFDRFCTSVLQASDAEAAYGDFVATWRREQPGREPLRAPHRHGSSASASDGAGSASPEAKTGPAMRRPPEQSGTLPVQRPGGAPSGDWGSLPSELRATLLAARTILRRIQQENLEAILAGIGQAFAAVRVATMLLGQRGNAPRLLVETGLADFDAKSADPFLLGYRNLVSSRRLSDVEDVLGVLVCGNGSRCLGVVGGAQVDERGNINSTRVAGRLLVGSGGANDIASAADELIVVTRALPGRLPRSVDFVTSAGWGVRSIVTEHWELHREGDKHPWRVEQWIEASPGSDGPRQLPEWAQEAAAAPKAAPPPSEDELEALNWLDQDEAEPEMRNRSQSTDTRRVS